MKTRTASLFLIKIMLIFLVCPIAEAVFPPPDGGYPGGNTAEGQSALLGLTTGTYNTALGVLSLTALNDGDFNTGVGAGTLLVNTANQNTATGAGALLSNATGDQCTGNGAFALFSNTTGSFNTAIGASALKFNTTGGLNTAVGFGAVLQDTSGSSNTAIGFAALQNNTTGSNNIALGVGAGDSVSTADNVITIGASGDNVDNGCYIGNIFNEASVNGIAVIINSANKLGTTVSSKRFKEEIKPMNQMSEAILALNPVTFRYTKELDPKGTPQFGLIAEDVEKVNPHLVVCDKRGKPYSVRYDQVNAMLLNEFLKAHRKMEKQQKQIDGLTAQLEQQAALIQKISDGFKLNRSEQQAVARNK